MVVILMGVSGSGKSTVGATLAARLGWPFHDGDSFHPPANVAKMKSGSPLNDDDRRPWLLAIQDFIRTENAAGRNAVIACSALKSSYRALLLHGDPQVRFAHLHGTRDLIASRLLERKGHFMPPTLLDSQLATLESSDDIPQFDIAGTPEEIADRICRELELGSTPNRNRAG